MIKDTFPVTLNDKTIQVVMSCNGQTWTATLEGVTSPEYPKRSLAVAWAMEQITGDKDDWSTVPLID